MLKNKTTFRLFLLLGVLIFTLVALVGCYNPDDNEIVTDEKLILDYVNYAHSIGQKDVTVENTEILENYGVYDGAVIVKMNRGAYQVITNISFLGAGVKMQFSDTNTPLVYKNGNFYELEDAYMKVIITKESLIKLQDKISNGGGLKYE